MTQDRTNSTAHSSATIQVPFCFTPEQRVLIFGIVMKQAEEERKASLAKTKLELE